MLYMTELKPENADQLLFGSSEKPVKNIGEGSLNSSVICSNLLVTNDRIFLFCKDLPADSKDGEVVAAKLRILNLLKADPTKLSD